jgi:hypothetical protein
MTNRKVIPFRKRAPSPSELLVYRHATSKRHPQLQQLLFTDDFRLEPPRPKK